MMKPFAYLARLALFGALISLMASPAAAATAPQSPFLGRITQGIRTPVRLAGDRFGNIFVADPRGGGVLKYKATGEFVSLLPVKGARGVAVTPGGDLVVARSDAAAVLDPATGAEKFKLGAGAGQFKMAAAVAVDDAGEIYVTDSGDNCVQVFTPQGTPVPLPQAASGKPSNSFGSAGSLPGQFSLPTGIAFERLSGQLAVADTLNGRIQFFSKTGDFQSSLGASGGGALRFTSPRAIAFEYAKAGEPAVVRYYVVDSFQSQVQVVDASTGSFLGSIGGYGLAPGKLTVPADLLFDDAGNRLLVANGTGDVSLFGIDISVSQVPDITPPQLTLGQVPTVVSTPSVVLSGTVEAEAKLTVILESGGATVPVTLLPQSPAVSFWSATVTGLVPGPNVITVVARDEAQSATGLKAVVTFDPAALKVSIDPVSSPTNKTDQIVTGTRDSGATITLSSGTPVSFGPVSYPGPNTWQVAVSGLTQGDNLITATATGAAPPASVSAVISLDTTPPDLNVSTLVTGSITGSELLNVTGMVTDNGLLDKVTVNGQAVPVANEVFGALILLAPGDNTVTVQAFDKAGNVATDTRTVGLNRQRPQLAIGAPADGSTTNAPLLSLSGSAPAGSTVTLRLYNGSANGAPFSDLSQPGSGSSWSTNTPLPLDPGLNTVIASVTDLSGATAQAKVTVIYNAKAPPLALTAPESDRSVRSANVTVGGATAPGAVVSASIDQAPARVTRKDDGSFSIPVALAGEGIHVVAVTATGPLGNAASSFRHLNLDLTPPAIVAASANPPRVTFSDGVPSARDKNGPVAGATVTANADGSVTIDLGNASYDAATLNIEALDAVGNSSRNGDADGNGKVDAADALLALRMALGIEEPSFEKLLRCDVAPTVNGVPSPDGVIDILDVIYIQEKAAGLH